MQVFPPSPTNITVLLVFNEASATLEHCNAVQGISQFRLLRRALRGMACELRTVQCFCVLVDTSSRIQNFSPSAPLDPSSSPFKMEAEVRASKLYHPFVLCCSFNAFFELLPESTRDTRKLLTSEDFYNAGRPLMASIKGALQDQLDFLWRKLNGCSGVLTEKGALGHVLCRLAVFVHPHHEYASHMVAENMATLLAADINRDCLLVSYVSEPKLAIAAAVSWCGPAFVEKLLPALHHALVTGSISNGPRGELVAQIILLCAFDKACENRGIKPGGCVMLKEVLEQLLPSGFEIDFNCVIPKGLCESKLACCQFVNLAHKVSPQTLVDLAERHSGVAFCEGQRGVDLAVPIMSSSLAVLLIQVKNLCKNPKHGSVSKRACEKMWPSKAFGIDKFCTKDRTELNQCCVRVYMQLGSSKATVHCGPGRMGAQPLEIFGMNSRCLSPDVKHALSLMIDGHINLEKFVNYQSQQLEKSNQPIVPFPDTLENVRQSWPFLIENTVIGSLN